MPTGPNTSIPFMNSKSQDERLKDAQIEVCYKLGSLLDLAKAALTKYIQES